MVQPPEPRSVSGVKDVRPEKAMPRTPPVTPPPCPPRSPTERIKSQSSPNLTTKEIFVKTPPRTPSPAVEGGRDFITGRPTIRLQLVVCPSVRNYFFAGRSANLSVC